MARREREIKNTILVVWGNPMERPPNVKIAASIAMTRKIMERPNITVDKRNIRIEFNSVSMIEILMPD